MSRKGTISVNTADVFPIIKKWLYSEHDIFVRELVSNASDAITKRKTLSRTSGEECPEGKITVEVSQKNKWIKITDNGLGMSEAEVEKYIAQLAFSGAKEFVEKMEKTTNAKEEIIGQFGLGFYSAFMVAKQVTVDSLSMQKDAVATRWTCQGETDYSFNDSDKTDVGTIITLEVNDESLDFLNSYKLRESLKRHCSFMPYPIELIDVDNKKAEDKEEIINQTAPLWKKDPKEIKDEEYKEFYRHLFPFEPEPLFWIHLNVDHPFELKGILYFPKLIPNKPVTDKNIFLYCKQVFVSDNVKNVIPDFLALLKGIIDSTDIPLNISRSSLQGDPNIAKISNYIVKKVGESLKKLFNQDRKKYEEIWPDIHLFVKYGIISDNKFDTQMRSHVIFKNSEANYQTLEEYQASIPENYKEKLKNKYIYFAKGKSDISLRNQLLQEKIQTIETEDYIDPHFIQHIEMNKSEDQEYKFSSVDNEIENLFTAEATTEEDIKIKEVFAKFLGSKDGNIDDKNKLSSNLDIEVKSLKSAEFAAYFKIDEQMKRLKQMSLSMGGGNAFPIKKTLVLNPQNPLIKNMLLIWEKGQKEKLVEKICFHVQDLAQISSEGLDQNEKESFVKRSQDLVQELSSFAIH